MGGAVMKKRAGFLLSALLALMALAALIISPVPAAEALSFALKR